MKKLVISLIFLSVSSVISAEKLSKEHLDFFENKIRPILVNKCYKCHSAEAKKSKGGLLVDSREALLKGGESGASLVPGNPEKSMLIKAVRYLDEDIEMPPKKKLEDQEIQDLVQWVKMGAPDPRGGKAALTKFEKILEKGKEHWAFKKVKQPEIPKVKNSSSVKTYVDNFILSKLEDNKLSFAPEADRRTLLRRLYFDMIGLPPTYEQIKAFEKDSQQNPEAAYEKVIDQLLASPHYGERWGRHWLDVARYADNMGAIFNGDDSYPHAHTYRDYVIRSFNEDKPYDRFILEQLAADKLNLPEANNRDLAAMGFLTIGRKPNRRIDNDTIDDVIDTVSRGLLGMSVGCARCHDHKLEPIPTKDYYSLYGIIRSSTEPPAFPVITPLPNTKEFKEYEKQNKEVRTRFIEVYALEAMHQTINHINRTGDYMLAAHEADYTDPYDKKAKFQVKAKILEPRGLHLGVYRKFQTQLKKQMEENKDIFTPWLEYTALKPEEFAAKAPELAKKYKANKGKKFNVNVASTFGNFIPKNLTEVAWAYNGIFARVDNMWGEKFKGALLRNIKPNQEELGLSLKDLEAAAVDRLRKGFQLSLIPKTDSYYRLVEWISSEKSLFIYNGKDFLRNRVFTRDVASGLRRDVKTKLTNIMKHPGAPPRAMVMVDAEKMYKPYVFLRGKGSSRGPAVDRQFFKILEGENPKPFPKDQSGRLAFAKKVVDPENPLTARIIVNRIWQWHFGEAIVRTPSDFGLQGDKPTHPELLDYMASQFVKDGWSFKKMHKTILLSRTYRQQSNPHPEMEKVDPENKLWRRMNPRALEFEPFRDSLLTVSERINLSLGGKAQDITRGKTTKRTVYAKIDRKNLPNLFRSFNFPDPTFTAPQRKRSSLTPESLYMLNSPFIVDNAKALAKKVQPKKKEDSASADAVKKLYRKVLQRDPSNEEVQDAVAYIKAYPKTDEVVPEASDWLYGFGDYDEKSGKVTFNHINRFSGKIIKGQKLKDMDLSDMEINATGGIVVDEKATIRRWTAPFDGTVSVYAELLHSNVKEDKDGKQTVINPNSKGVFCRVVSSRKGSLGSWNVVDNAVMTNIESIKVKAGDTLDFITFCKGEDKGERFTWAPTITMKDKDIPAMKGMAMRWDAKTNFMDPSKLPQPLGPWEELAQILLLSNEFAIAD